MALSLGVNMASAQALPSQAVQPNQPMVETSDESYLYGQVKQPNQLQQGYVVFEQFGDTVVGASYYPRSEFRCLIGNFNSKSEALSGVMLAAMQTEQATVNIDLSSLHPINTLSQNDQRLLATCKQVAVNRQDQLPAQWQSVPSAWLQQ
ncbi:hypothetical protein HRE53_21795 [Acaryochloris sp. 'Moss Beach']|nr:hypothetical protein HRE53_21795 [Acaryochloris sp. 'Moss Beach']